MKKLTKWLLVLVGAVTGIVTVLLALLIYQAPKPSDLIPYSTQNYSFKIPYHFVVPGTLPNQPSVKGYDTESQTIFVWFKGEYVKEQIPGFKTKSGKDNQYFRSVHVSLTDGSEQDMAKYWGWDKRLEALSLSGSFKSDFVEYSEALGLYRVFREHEGNKLSRFWELVAVEPTKDYKPGSSYQGVWLASCHQKANDIETSCYFYTDVLGMYTRISVSEDDYLRLDKIKAMVAAHLQSWMAP